MCGMLGVSLSRKAEMTSDLARIEREHVISETNEIA